MDLASSYYEVLNNSHTIYLSFYSQENTRKGKRIHVIHTPIVFE